MDHSRQSELIPEEIEGLRIAVIGAGATGSVITAILTRTGAIVHLYDGDTLQKENLQSTLMDARKIGKPKPDAVLSLTYLGTNEKELVVPHNHMVEDEVIEADVIIVAIDSLDGRKELWEKGLLKPSKLFVDVRMGGWGATVFAFDPIGDGPDIYSAILQDVKEEPLPCGQKATASVTFIAAGLAVLPLTQQLNGKQIPWFTTFMVGDEISLTSIN